MKSYKKLPSRWEEKILCLSNVYVSSLKKKRKKSSRSLRTESGAKLAMDCYVAVYYASGREREREGERTARYPVNTID